MWRGRGSLPPGEATCLTCRRTTTDPAVQIWTTIVKPLSKKDRGITMANTTARGYGWDHQRRRLEWKKKVDTGTVRCARCKRIITPDPRKLGDGWQLDHDPTDPTRQTYLGPSHTACNQGGAHLDPTPSVEPRPATDWSTPELPQDQASC